MAERMEMNKIL